MRDILFRGKRKDNGEWVEGFYICVGEKYHYILTGKLNLTKYGAEFEKYSVDLKTVGQFTGLTDKNRKRIFEGDIINDTDDNELLVVEGETSFGFSFRYVGDDGYTSALDLGLNDDMMALPYAEVVGNIYDNPELVEV